MALEIALWQPEIPPNTGNIARTCVAIGSPLHLIEPLGFSLDDRHLKRAGLDYWFDLDLTLWPDLETFLRGMEHKTVWALTTKARTYYSDVAYPDDSVLLFGAETRGLPEPYLATHAERALTIPMIKGNRSLNLANSVAIVAYEYLRQHGYPGLQAARFEV